MDRQRRRALVDGLLILAAGLAVVVFFCVAWSACDRLGWVRFVAALPFPGWVKMLLWGWV